jgi:hypothetical protein
MEIEKLRYHISLRVLEIVKEITTLSVNGFASYEVVLQKLLDSLKVSHWNDLQIGTIENVPVILYLFNINQKVTFRCFLSTLFSIGFIFCLFSFPHRSVVFFLIILLSMPLLQSKIFTFHW